MGGTDDRSNRKWKSIIKYLAGLLGLTATIVLALVLPDLYSGWQDGKLLDQVTLSTREEIHFLDTDALDISARLQMLAETQDFYYTSGAFLSYTYSGTPTPVQEDLLEKCRTSLEKWNSYHLLPEGLENMVRAEDNMTAAYYYVQIDAGMIPVIVMCFGENPFLQVIMDADNGFLYYVGCAGDDSAEYIFECLGISGEEDLDKALTEGAFSFNQIRDASRYLFTELTGADSQKIRAADFSGLYLDAELRYEDYSSMAYRRLFEHYAASPGIVVMFGTRNWGGLAVETVELFYGGEEWLLSVTDWTNGWNEMVEALGRPDMRQDADATDFEEYRGNINEEEEESLIIDGVIPGKQESYDSSDGYGKAVGDSEESKEILP